MSWPNFWMEFNWKTRLLRPLSKLVCWEASRRLTRFNQQPPEPQTFAKVIVVGNLVVGGSGKTPFIIWLTKQLQAQGFRVGIISRGYGGKANTWPQWVTVDSEPKWVGDEPVLLAKQLGCAISVSPNRPQAIQQLNQKADLDVIISDDGLQHYALARDIEIVLMDAQRQIGNGLCLPAGPLREPVARLNQVDACVWNGLLPQADFPLSQFAAVHHSRMQLVPVRLRQVMNPDNVIEVTLDRGGKFLSPFLKESVYAVAGIGYPKRFFNTLKMLGFQVIEIPFADHHQFTWSDFQALDTQKRLLMTEKDAVKCMALAKQHHKHNWWYLEVQPQCDSDLLTHVLARLTP